VLAHLGLVDYLGHVSARIPGREEFVITPRGHTVGGLQFFAADDLLVIDTAGHRVEGVHPVPNEVYIHTEIFRARPDVQSVVHTHQPMAVAAAIAGRSLRPVHITGCELFARPVPLHDCPNLANDPQKGRAVAAALGAHHLLLLRGHGIVSTGESVEEAALGAIYLEEQAWHAWRALQFGGARELAPAEIAQHQADMELARRTGGGAGGAWRCYTALLGGEGRVRPVRAPRQRGRK
jgi:L-fuculose-phosphate aldolase/L-ribulose-5-phosphate 4-epimerase